MNRWFVGFLIFTLATPFIAGFAAYHGERRVAFLSFSAIVVLLVWSLSLFGRARRLCVLGLVSSVVTLWLLLVIPGYVEARRRATQQAAGLGNRIASIPRGGEKTHERMEISAANGMQVRRTPMDLKGMAGISHGL